MSTLGGPRAADSGSGERPAEHRASKAQPHGRQPAPQLRAAREAAVEDENRLGHLLWETSSRLRLLAESAMSDTQLHHPSIGALQTIATQPGITVSQLARRALKSQQSVSQIVARLERLGYVERRLGSGRSVGLYITVAGTAALAAGNAQEASFEQQIELLLGRARYSQLRSLLQQTRALLIARADEHRPTDAAARRRHRRDGADRRR